MGSKMQSGPKTKQAFPGAKLPGKSQSKDRSAGKPKLPVDPDRKGL